MSLKVKIGILFVPIVVLLAYEFWPFGGEADTPASVSVPMETASPDAPAIGDPESSTPAIPSDDPLRDSEFRRIHGWSAIQEILSSDEVIRIPIMGAQAEGFELNDVVYHPRQALRLRKGSGWFSVEIPGDGHYFPGIIVYDGPGSERFEVELNGRRLGEFVADLDDNREALYVSSTGYPMRQGDLIKFSANPSRAGLAPSMTSLVHRVEDVVLLVLPPQPLEPVYQTKFVGAARVDAPAGSSNSPARITWVTTWPARCSIEYGAGGSPATTVEEDQAWNNHRLLIEKLVPGESYQYRIACPRPDGTDAQTAWLPLPEPGLDPLVGPDSLTVPLVVSNPSSLSREQAPVSAGVPLPEGRVWANSFELVDDDGRRSPVQTVALEHWGDGSMKWVLADFQANLAPNESRAFSMRAIAPDLETSGEPMARWTTDDTVIVDTGLIQVRFAKGYAPFQSLYLDQNGDREFSEAEKVIDVPAGGALIIRDGDNYLSMPSGSAQELSISRNGTLASIVTIRGLLTGSEGQTYESEFQIHAHRDHQRIRIDHILVSHQSSDTLKSIEFSMPLNGGEFENYSMGGATSQAEPVSSSRTTLRQMRDDRWELVRPSHTSFGKRADGWILGKNADVAVAVSLRPFWQQWPKSLWIEPGSIGVGLLPEFQAQEMATDDPIELTKLFYNYRDDKYVLPQGLQKSHEMYLWVGPSGQSLSAGAEFGRESEFVLKARPDPHYSAGTGALGDVAVLDDQTFPFYTSLFDKMLAAYPETREKNHEYGFLNFGDYWMSESFPNWGNNQYDISHGLLHAWMLGGADDTFALGESAARHTMDVDVVHHRAPRDIGSVYWPGVGHIGGGWFEEKPTDVGTYSTTTWKVRHAYIDGILDYYHLTGNEIARRTALKIADHYAGYYTLNLDFIHAGEAGSFLIMMAAAYRATSDAFYLNAMRMAVERMLERETPDIGGWDRILTSGHCDLNPPYLGEANFMLGLLLSGLKRYHQITGDETVQESIVRAARRLVEEHWNPQRTAFRYTSCPTIHFTDDLNSVILEGLGYAWRLSDDPQLARPLLADAPHPLWFDHGRGFARIARFAPHTLYEQDSAHRVLFNVTSEDGVRFIFKHTGGPYILSLRAYETAAPPTALTVADPSGTTVEDSIAVLGSAAIRGDGSSPAGVYVTRVQTHGSTGWSGLSDTAGLMLDVGQGITLKGQQAARIFWIRVPAATAGWRIALDSETQVQVRIHDTTGIEVASCVGADCQVELHPSQQNEDQIVKLHIQNEHAARLTIEGIPALLSAFQKQLFDPQLKVAFTTPTRDCGKTYLVVRERSQDVLKRSPGLAAPPQSVGFGPLAFPYSQNGPGSGVTFTDVGAAAGLDSQGCSYSAAWADYDNDGWVDLFVSYTGRPDVLYRNDGLGAFTDVSLAAGIRDDLHTAAEGVTWGDFDNDGDLDLFVANIDAADRLYRNEGDGTFINVTETAGVGYTGRSVGVSWADYDNDGDLDLYVGVQISPPNTPNILYRNNGDGTFANVSQDAGVADPSNSNRLLKNYWAGRHHLGDSDKRNNHQKYGCSRDLMTRYSRTSSCS